MVASGGPGENSTAQGFPKNIIFVILPTCFVTDGVFTGLTKGAKMWKFNWAALVCFACLPGLAGDKDITLIATKQFTRTSAYSNGAVALRYDVEQPMGMNIRFGWMVQQITNFYFQVYFSYHFTTSAAVRIDGINKPPIDKLDPSFSSRLTDDFKNQGLSVGISINRHQWIDYGFGLEARMERLWQFDARETYTRPWARANVGTVIKNGKISNLFGFETSVALTRVHSNPTGLDLKSFAPNREVGIFMGIRY
ncbi:MAG: hypothetical protein HY823_06110 [Acidobacteria bacterium]|nr:hypothetical protein [Acidobacteriota bacterium]